MTVNGKPTSLRRTTDAIKHGFGFCPEDRKAEGILGDLSVRENIVIALQGKLGWFKALNRDEQLEIAGSRLRDLGMRSAIETGARFLLDANVKHEPTLVTSDPAGRARRVDFLCRAIDVAASLRSDCVSFWSGIVRDWAGDREAMDRLVEGLLQVIDYAGAKNVPLAFEPGSGLVFVESDEAMLSAIESVRRIPVSTRVKAEPYAWNQVARRMLQVMEGMEDAEAYSRAV